MGEGKESEKGQVIPGLPLCLIDQNVQSQKSTEVQNLRVFGRNKIYQKALEIWKNPRYSEDKPKS